MTNRLLSFVVSLSFIISGTSAAQTVAGDVPIGQGAASKAAAPAATWGSLLAAPELSQAFGLTPETNAALSRLLAPGRSLRPEALQGLPIDQQVAKIHAAVIASYKHELVTVMQMSPATGNVSPLRLRNARERLEDLRSLSTTMHDLDAEQIEKGKSKVETILAEHASKTINILYPKFSDLDAKTERNHFENIEPQFDGRAGGAAEGPVAAAQSPASPDSSQSTAGGSAATLKKPDGSVHGTGREGASKRPAVESGEPGDSGSAAAPRVGAKPLPQPQDIASSLPSLDEAVEMHISHSYPGKEGVDPAEKVAKEIDEYVARKDIPLKEKHFVLKYYEIGDPPAGHSTVVQAVERLVKAGIRTTILTDFNQSLTGAFPNDELHNTDFEHATYKDSGPGRSLKYLRESLGFSLEYGKGLFSVLSGVPLFNPRDKGEKPLMHDKGVFAMGPGGKAYQFAWNGTANMNATEEKTPGPLPAFGGRYNRVLRSMDPEANGVDWSHLMGEIDAYDKRLGSKGLSRDLDVPQRVNYPNGEFREIAFTNGRQNPNDRITDLFLSAAKALSDAQALKAKSPGADIRPKFEIQEVIFSHFVLTDTPEVEAFRKYLDALRTFYPDDYRNRVKVFGVFDQQFISPDGFGEAAAIDGLLVQRPMGKSIFPFRTEYLPMMKLFGYIRLLSGVDKIDPDAAPTKVHLWHDKTTIIKTVETDPKTDQAVHWTHAFTRSLNDSGHYQSLESQDHYRMRPDSRLAKDFDDSVKKVAEAEPQYAIDLDKALVMFWLAHFTHHTVYDPGMLGYAEKGMELLTKGNYEAVKSLLAEIVSLPTKHAKAVAASEVMKRIEQFVRFLSWYKQEAGKDPSLNPMTYRKAINIGVGLSSRGPWGLRTALDILYYDFKRSPEDTQRLMRKAWIEGLQMSEPFPGSGNDGTAAAGRGEPLHKA